MDVLALQKLATRPLRFLHHLRTTKDFSGTPYREFVLRPPSGDVMTSLGIHYSEDIWVVISNLRLVPGGRWLLGIAYDSQLKDSNDSGMLLCWDLSTPSLDIRTIFPAKIVKLRLRVFGNKLSDLKLRYRELERDFIIVVRDCSWQRVAKYVSRYSEPAGWCS